MTYARIPFRLRLTRGLALALCVAALGAQAPLRTLEPQELALIRAGLPARLDLANEAIAGIRNEERLGANHSFQARPPLLDAFGQLHVRYDQFYRGVRVWDGMAIVHVGAVGGILEPTLALRRDLSQSVEPVVPLAEAQAAAAAHPALKESYPRPVKNELVLYPVLGERIGRILSQPGGKLNAADLERYADYHVLAWHIRLNAHSAGSGFQSRDYIVDALTGSVVKSWDSLQTAEAVGTGKSQYSGDKSLNTYGVTGGFELKDLTRPTRPHPVFGYTGNVTHDMNHGVDGTDFNRGTLFTDADNVWGDGANYSSGSPTTSGNGQTAAVDAHYGLQTTWDYFKNVHAWIGADNLGSAILSRVHYDNAYVGAFWDEACFCITYGDGNEGTTVLTALDWAAHELSHGFMSSTAGLVYEDEPGGLNEANSDIHGAMVEFYGRGGGGSTIGNSGGNWTLGEQIAADPLRWMYKPCKDNCSPDEWVAGMGVMDVHYGSGPMNRAFYFLSQGAPVNDGSECSTPNLPTGMTGIGNDKAARIWFRAVSAYLTPYSFYWDARGACVRAARDLYGQGSSEVAAVKNAFGGINVGSLATSDDADPALTVSPPATSTGILNFMNSYSDNVGVVRVDWYLDNVWWATQTSVPYNLVLDSTQIANGSHTLRARARDVAGNIGHSNLVAFTANNTTEQLVFNPSLESGTFGWGADRVGTIAYQDTRMDAHAGNYFLRICGFGLPRTNSAYQQLRLPADAARLDLSFWLRVKTDETLPGIWDTLAVRVYNADESALLGTLAEYSNIDAGSYARRTFDLMPYKGQDIVLSFWGNEDPSIATTFFLDDVTVHATYPALPFAPQITAQPAGATVYAGQTASFSVTAIGSPEPSFQWKRDGQNIDGATSPGYSTPATTLADNNSTYSVVVSNSKGSVSSDQALLTVNPPLVVSLSPNPAQVLPSGQLMFTASVTGTSNTAVSWSLSGIGNLSGSTATSTIYTAAGTTGTAILTATSLADGSKYDSATITTVPVLVSVSPKPATVMTGGQLIFTANVAGNANTSVSWSLSGGGSLSGSTATSTTYTAPVAGGIATITAASQVDASCSDSATITIKTRDFNGDSTVDVLDLALFARAFGSGNAIFDLDGNGTVTDADFALFLAGI